MLQIIFGARHENITTLAVSSASGKVLDQLIVFSGKNMQGAWKGSKPLPNLYYGISENGWMDTSVFANWFKLFCGFIKDRPLLLLYDGHLSHISLIVVQLALKENVIILKFPPYVTDVLQPLDVSCFGLIKRKWEKMLNDRITTYETRNRIDKSEFVDLLCKIWHDRLKPENAISGFSSTGI